MTSLLLKQHFSWIVRHLVDLKIFSSWCTKFFVVWLEMLFGIWSVSYQICFVANEGFDLDISLWISWRPWRRKWCKCVESRVAGGSEIMEDDTSRSKLSLTFVSILFNNFFSFLSLQGHRTIESCTVLEEPYKKSLPSPKTSFFIHQILSRLRCNFSTFLVWFKNFKLAFLFLLLFCACNH